MSRSVTTIMCCILDVLKSFVSDEDKHRIKTEKCNIKADVEDESPVIDFVAKAKYNIKFIKNGFLSCYEYNSAVYILVPKDTENSLSKLGLSLVEDVVICQGIGMIAISQKALPLKNGIHSLDLIEAFLGEKTEEILFSEITELFEPYIVFEAQSDRFAIEYEEDIERINALISLDQSLITANSKGYLENFLLLHSSRGLSSALMNAIDSTSWEYSYLQLYHCLEYLFIIRQAEILSDEYTIKIDAAIDIASSGRLRAVEHENLFDVLALTPDIHIDNFYGALILGKGQFESGDKRMSVTKYIYKLRCCIAHLRFKQETIDVDGEKAEILERISEIVYGTYQQNDIEIINMCKSKSPWHQISWSSK